MLLNFSGEWSIVDHHNEKWSGAIGAIEDVDKKIIIETIHVKLLFYETKNRNIKNKVSWIAKMKKKYKWK